MIKSIPFDYNTYIENPEDWTLECRTDGIWYKVVAIFKTSADESYPLKGVIYNPFDETYDEMCWTLNGEYDRSTTSNTYDITDMTKVEKLKKETSPQVVVYSSIKICIYNIVLDNITGCIRFVGGYLDIKEALVAGTVLEKDPSLTYLGIHSLHNHPSFEQVLLEKGLAKIVNT